MAYWKNRFTGEVKEHWKNPDFSSWTSAPEPTDVKIARQKAEVSKPFQEAMKYYQPGGGYGAGVEAGLDRGRTQSMASGMNALIGSGLAGTTMAAGLGKKYEEEVAAPTRAGVESTRAQNLAALNMAMGGAQQSASQFTQGMDQSSQQFSQSQAMQKYMADLQAQGQSNQLGLGYAGLRAGQQQAAGQLGLGYAGLQAGQQQAAGQLGLGYAELNAKMNAKKQVAPTGSNFKVPTSAPSLFSSAAPTTTAKPQTWSSSELTALNQKLGNKATGF